MKIIGMDTCALPLLVALTASAAVTTFAPAALAQDSEATTDAPDVETAGEKRRVLVGKFAGAKPTSARTWTVEGLADNPDLEVVDEDASLSLPAGSTQAKIAAAAKAQGADIVILGTSSLGKKGWNAKIDIYDHQGNKLETVKVQGGSFSNYETALRGGEAIAGPLAAAPGWPRPEPEPEVLEEEAEEEPAEEAEEASEDDGMMRPSPLSVRVGFGMNGRSLRYTDTLADLYPEEGFDAPKNYTQDAAPMPQVDLLWFPAAHFTDTWVSHLGVSGGFQTVVGVNPQTVINNDAGDSAVVDLSQSNMRWYAGLEGRIPVGPLRFLVDARFTNQISGIDGDDVMLDDAGEVVPGPAQAPDISFQSVALGADLEWRPDQLIFGGHARYLAVLDVGDIGSDEWFPSASAHGVDFGVRAGWAFTKVFEVLVGFETQMYGLDFNPIPSDQDPAKVAGGATDRYTTVWLGLGFNLPGDAPQSAASDDDGGSDDDFDSFD